MARIRTIKPEFCTSDQLVECSTNARLMFATMWCFFDDGGNHPAHPKRLKMEIFPADDFTPADIQAMMDELITQGLVVEYEAEGQLYWHVTGWDKHQKIDRPNPKYPKFDESSTIIRRTFDDHSPPEGKGRELESRKGKERINAAVMKIATGEKPTAAEKAFFDCFATNENRIKELYPYADFETERETCIAHYRGSPPPLDCYPVVLKWFNRIPKPKEPKPAGMSERGLERQQGMMNVLRRLDNGAG